MAETELETIVGSENVFDSPEILEEYSSDLSFVSRVRPRCVVKPQNADEVQAIVKWANKTSTPLVPVSSGPPHFRGDTVPSAGGAVIVDLNRMKRIIRIDTRNKVAMVEPGVTFAELMPALAKAGMRPYTPLCPKPSKSVVGSILEREPITDPAHHWDCTDPQLCAEIIFGTGDKMRSGEAAGPDTTEEQWEIGKAQMCPFGLSQFNENRLISGAQGTIGIITWATLKLTPLSRLNRILFVPSEKLEPLIDLSYKLLRIRMGDNLFILNGLNLACLLCRNRKEIEELRAMLPPWVFIISSEGYGELPEEKVEYQEADIREIAKGCYLEVKTSLPGVEAEAVNEVLSKPSAKSYWKQRFKGSFQDIFFLTTLDKTPKFVEAMQTLARSSRYPGEDIGVYLQPVVQGTSCHCEFNLFYDAAKPNELAGAKSLVTEKVEHLARLGGFFSRPYGPWADVAYRRAPDTVDIQKKVKKIFDPNAVLNPGKLCF
jgi:hypothetical protein